MFPESFMKTETQKRTLFWIYNQQYDFAQNSRYTPIYQWTSCSQFSLSRIKLRGTQLISAEIFRDRGQGSKVVSHPCHPNWSENRRPVFLWKSPLYPIDPMVDSPHILHVSNFFTNYLGVFSPFSQPSGSSELWDKQRRSGVLVTKLQMEHHHFRIQNLQERPPKTKIGKNGKHPWKKMGKNGKNWKIHVFAVFCSLENQNLLIDGMKNSPRIDQGCKKNPLGRWAFEKTHHWDFMVPIQI